MTAPTGQELDNHNVAKLLERLASLAVDFNKPLNNQSLNQRISNKNIMVTGGASGIGEAFVRGLVDKATNIHIIIADRDRLRGEALEEELLAQGARIKFIAVDVTNWESQVSLFQTGLSWLEETTASSEIDHLICCAGVLGEALDLAPSPPSALFAAETPSPPTTRCIRTSMEGIIFTAQLAIKYAMGLEKATNLANDKSILLVGSQAGYGGMTGRTDYCASKWGIRGVFKSLLDDRNSATCPVRINLLAPYFVQTPLLAGRMDAFKAAGIKFARLEDIETAALRLISDRAIHGRSIGVSSNGAFDWCDDLAGGFGAHSLLEQIESGTMPITNTMVSHARIDLEATGLDT